MQTLRMVVVALVVLCLGISGLIVSNLCGDYIFLLMDLLVGMLSLMLILFLIIWHLEAKRES